jgi:hypothetical protein
MDQQAPRSRCIYGGATARAKARRCIYQVCTRKKKSIKTMKHIYVAKSSLYILTTAAAVTRGKADAWLYNH